MKSISKIALLVAVLSVSIIACKKDVKDTPADDISQETLSKIAHLGFSTSNVQRVDEGYLVEGDIILSEANLNENPTSPNLRIAEVEQYRTFNLVTGLPRVIRVSSSGDVTASVSSAIDAAIARYNAQNLQLTFQRVASGGNINITVVNGGSYIASAGFPSGGNPYNEVKFNKRYAGYSAGFLTTVIAHEMGHCIGFRHTDYMNGFTPATADQKGNGDFVHADVKQYLKTIAPGTYDLIVMDPPTFSNSKRMEDFLDIQQDHAQLINEALRALGPGGILYFSTNFRKFKMDTEKINASTIQDITRASTPFDFEGRLFRYCFRIIK